MGLHEIRKGLSLPIGGQPRQEVSDAPAPRRVALLGEDYPGTRPTMLVREGERVELGQPLFEDKKTPGVQFTSPGGGRIVAVNRGERRAFQSIVVELEAEERRAAFRAAAGDPEGLGREGVRSLLLESGLWTALRARPFGRVANPERPPRSIFVTAVDSHPLSASPEVALSGREERFADGLRALAQLTDGPVYVCTGPRSSLQLPAGDRFRHERFSGPHPAGTPGLHIHRLDPVDRNKVVWHLGCQDVAAIGELFATGRLDVTRVVSLAGPGVKDPRLLRTRLGASTDALTEGELREGEQRVISGSVLSGRKAAGEVHGYLGRYHTLVSVLPEGRRREFLGWLAPGSDRFSVVRAFLSSLTPGKTLPFTTTTHGSRRAIVPIGTYEKVTPMDILPTFLLRALLVRDLERAEELGCLELDEEDVSLMTFVCPGKNEYGPHLRAVLDTLEKEG